MHWERLRQEATVSRRSDRDAIDVVRRKLLQAMLATPAVALAGRAGVTSHASSEPPTATLQLTPACDDGDDDPTPPQTEGPYFTTNSPERASLVEAGMVGTRLTLSGRVLSMTCQPVARAKLDFWQADDSGVYDNAGFRLRGHLYTDANGRFTLQTIVPGLYPGRTRHLHVKAQAPNKPVLTTQLYFPEEARNTKDRIFSPKLLMNVSDSGRGRSAAFNFVLAV
jgi:protocatechuate 3,4-dioxygenase beta subunit